MYSYYIFFDRHKLIIKSVICVVCLLASIFAISYSKGVVELNKYHATYFGSYLYMKNNGYKMPSYVDDKCVGLDAGVINSTYHLAQPQQKLERNVSNLIKMKRFRMHSFYWLANQAPSSNFHLMMV